MNPNTVKRELDALDGHGLIRQAKAQPELEYMFKHALVQEAAYESLLKAARSDWHRRVAQVIEAQGVERIEQELPALAMHYERAGDPTRAMTYALRAGEAARRMYANEEALAFYAQALEQARQLPGNDPRRAGAAREAHAHRGSVLEVLGRPLEAIENYGAMLAAARASSDRSAEADAMNRLNRTRVVSQGPLTLPQEELTAALAAARESGDVALIGYALHNLGLYFRFIEPLRAADHFQQAYDLTQAGAEYDAALRELAANSLLDSMIAMIVSGRFRRGLDYGRLALAAYRTLDNKHMIADALGGMALILYWQGRHEQARELNDEGIRISTAIDNPWGLMYHEWRRYDTDLDRGNGEACIERLEERRAIAAQLGFPIFTGQVMHQAARAHLQRGEIARAITFGDVAGDAFESVQVTSWRVWGRGVRALPHLRAGDVAYAREQLESLWRPGHSYDDGRQGFLLAGPVMAEWALADGRIDYGLALCDWLLDWLEMEGADRIAGEVRYWRARLRLANGDVAGAGEDFRQAREWLAACDARVLLRQVDAALEEMGSAD